MLFDTLVDPGTDIAPLIQAQVDRMSNGGVIVIPASPQPYHWNTPVTVRRPIRIIGLGHMGGPNAYSVSPSVSIRVGVPSSQYALVFATETNGDPQFCGASLSGLAFHAAGADAGGVVHVDQMSDCIFERLVISEFKNTGGAMRFTGPTGQYSRLTDCYFNGTPSCIRGSGYNGVVLVGCYFDPANNFAQAINGTCIATDSGCDTWKYIGCQWQGMDVGVDTASSYDSFTNCRFEGFNTGIILRGNAQQVGTGCSFNAYLDGTGLGIKITNTAIRTIVHPASYGATYYIPVEDGGLATIRKDSLPVSVSLRGQIDYTSGVHRIFR